MSRLMTQPQIIHTISELRRRVASWRNGGARIGMVPTMGALHAGHLSLVEQVAAQADKVVISIFVNPTQFAPHEDFDSYPRTLEEDRAKLTTGKADLIFAPSVSEMYPNGHATTLTVGGPSEGLETDFRPHFFGGVATVVAKLLIAAMPDIAIFGEKDYQQLLVIRRMAQDLALPTEIAGAAIVREPDGLALSSRNAYLSTNERRVAGQLNVVLKDVIARLHGGMDISEAKITGKNALLNAGFDSVDYVAIRNAENLKPLGTLTGAARILAAAKIGKTRLIDNMPV
ncbi:MAG TPA: pantoate--beta-alanine ligase [Rhizomicrobium sp.]|nr:pantoate--beta-alanine ligase [Rhizomicrobium sp.]